MSEPVMLCAWCAGELYGCGKYAVSVWDVEYNRFVGEQIRNPDRALALAETGLTFKGAGGTVFRPRAITQVDGTLMCGACAWMALDKKGWKR